jgi:hypothetical protein
VADDPGNTAATPGGNARGAGRRERVAQALAGGLSLRQASAHCRVPFRTVARWHAEDAAFRARVSELRTALLSRAAGRLSAAGGKAARALAGLLGSEDERVRLAAAVKTLELAAKVGEAAELRERLEELERRMADNKGK